MKENRKNEVRPAETRIERELKRDWSGLSMKEQYWPHSPWRAFGLAFEA